MFFAGTLSMIKQFVSIFGGKYEMAKIRTSGRRGSIRS